MSPRDALRRLLAAPIAHRGLHAVDGPVENSVSAAQAAIAAGYGIECDIRLSRDGEAMVFHDAQLTRLIGREGEIAAHDAATLATMPLAGGPDTIPTLDAFLSIIGGRVPLVIEIKSEKDGDMRLADRALAVIFKYRGCVALECFDPAVVLHCRESRPLCPIGLVGPLEVDASPDAAAFAASDFLSWNLRWLARVANAGLPLSTWTVRTRADAAVARQLGAQIIFAGTAWNSLATTQREPTDPCD